MNELLQYSLSVVCVAYRCSCGRAVSAVLDCVAPALTAAALTCCVVLVTTSCQQQQQPHRRRLVPRPFSGSVSLQTSRATAAPSAMTPVLSSSSRHPASAIFCTSTLCIL